MPKFDIGQKVKMSLKPDLIFEIIHINPDETYEIQVKITENHDLQYGNISAEMLKKFDSALGE